MLVIGTSKSAKFTAVLVIVKILALTVFIVLAFPAVQAVNFEPMLPNGWGTPLSGVGALGAAASIFFAYVGFDAVSTAAEETKNPNRNIPIGLIASLAHLHDLLPAGRLRGHRRGRRATRRPAVAVEGAAGLRAARDRLAERR